MWEMRSISERHACRRLFGAIVPLLALLLALPALAQTPAAPASAPYRPPQQPFVQVETGFHLGAVNSVALAAKAPVLVTGSSDKTIRVWNTNDGSLQSVIRVPLASGLEGGIRTVAISPDGKTILAAGYTGLADGLSYYVIDPEQGEIKNRGRLPGWPASIAFSPAGDKFAIALVAPSPDWKSGVVLLNSDLKSNTNPQFDQKIVNPIVVTFASDGRFAAATADGTIRIYAADGTQQANRKLAGPGQPNSLAFSPSGDLLAVGFVESVRVEVLASLDLATRVTPSTAGIATGDLANVAFVVNHGVTQLIAGGAINNQDGDAMVFSWSEAGLGPRKVIAKARNTITALAGTLTGKTAIGTAEPSLMMLDQGQLATLVKSPTIDFRYVARGRLATDMEGTKVLFSTDKGQPLEIVDLANRTFGPYAAEKYADVQWFDAFAKATSTQVASWRLSSQPKVAGKPVAMQQGERSQGTDVSTEGLIALGTDMGVRMFSPAGVELTKYATSAPVYGVAFSGNGRRLITALGDGTIRIYDVEKDRLKTPAALSVFLHSDRQNWVAWMPEGFFDHSERGGGGQDLVGYALNRSARESPEWLTFSQLYKTLYAPSLVAKRLMADKQGEAEIQARVAALGDIRQQYEKALPPNVTLAEVCFDEGDTQVCRPPTELAARGSRGLAIEAVDPAGAVSPGGAAPSPASSPPPAASPPTAAAPPPGPAGRPASPPASAASAAPAAAAAAAAPAATRGSTDSAPRLPTIVLPADVTKVKLRYMVAPREGGIGNFDLMINDTNRGRARLRADALRNSRYVEREMAVDASPTTVTARAYDRSDTIFGDANPVIIRNAASPRATGKANLYVLAAGINEYREGKSWYYAADGKRKSGYKPLELARTDAENFARTIKEGAQGLYREIHVTSLLDDDATEANIVAALTDISSRANAEDTVLIYLAGHGDKVLLKDQKYDFMFVTANVDLTAHTERESKSPLQSIRTDEDFMDRVYPDAFKGAKLVELLSKLTSANVMVFLDTCHSGTVNLFNRDLDAVGSLSAEAGRYILAAAAEDETALDSYDGKTGVFATAVLRGLRGHRSIQRDKDGTIDQIALGFYVQDTLPAFVREINAKLKQGEAPFKQSARFLVAARNATRFLLSKPAR
jgi:WD40 repeat protein